MISIEGKFGIKATVVAHSVTPAGVELLTYELEYPRMILAEANTHRMLSKNSASSRAIPFLKMMEQLTARPVRFGQANPGMQDKGEDFDAIVIDAFDGEDLTPTEAWEDAKLMAVMVAEQFYKAGYHKQVYNRLVEPFQMMKTVMSGTEWNNFFWLRDDDAADPTIHELARVMKEAKDRSRPIMLYPGQWHLPYVQSDYMGRQGLGYYIEEEGKKVYLTSNQAIMVSCARSAAVSFRNTDYNLKKCEEVFQRLIGDERKHASALEHQATPMMPEDDDTWINIPVRPHTWQNGVSHMDRKMNLWSGNFRGWVQYRKTIPGENKEG